MVVGKKREQRVAEGMEEQKGSENESSEKKKGEKRENFSRKGEN